MYYVCSAHERARVRNVVRILFTVAKQTDREKCRGKMNKRVASRLDRLADWSRRRVTNQISRFFLFFVFCRFVRQTYLYVTSIPESVVQLNNIPYTTVLALVLVGESDCGPGPSQTKHALWFFLLPTLWNNEDKRRGCEELQTVKNTIRIKAFFFLIVLCFAVLKWAQDCVPFIAANDVLIARRLAEKRLLALTLWYLALHVRSKWMEENKL